MSTKDLFSTAAVLYLGEFNMFSFEVFALGFLFLPSGLPFWTHLSGPFFLFFSEYTSINKIKSTERI